MAILDKLMFWKKKDDFGSDMSNFDPSPNMGMGESGQDLGLPNYNPGMPEPQFGQQMPASQFGQAPPMFQQQSYAPMAPQMPQENFGKDMEIISAKIDSLRAYLESINQRLANIERMAMGEQEKRRGW